MVALNIAMQEIIGAKANLFDRSVAHLYIWLHGCSPPPIEINVDFMGGGLQPYVCAVDGGVFTCVGGQTMENLPYLNHNFFTDLPTGLANSEHNMLYD